MHPRQRPSGRRPCRRRLSNAPSTTDGSTSPTVRPGVRRLALAPKTYRVGERDGKIFLEVASAGGRGRALPATTYRFRVVSNDNVATFIKELVLEPEPGTHRPITGRASTCSSTSPLTTAYRSAKSPSVRPLPRSGRRPKSSTSTPRTGCPVARNYSFATAPGADRQLRFNVRISTPPPGRDCSAGTASTYIHRLKPGDTVTAIGPFGDFHIKPTEKEMVYLGGGAGMAPLRSHLAHLFETEQTGRRVSFWYGDRSLQEAFYRDYFDTLARRFPNFSFHLALSEPQPADNWRSYTGLIHEVLLETYLAGHADPAGHRILRLRPAGDGRSRAEDAGRAEGGQASDCLRRVLMWRVGDGSGFGSEAFGAEHLARLGHGAGLGGR